MQISGRYDKLYTWCFEFCSESSQKVKKKKALTALRLSVFLMSDEQDESAFLFYSEFNTTTWIKAPPVFNCPNEQGLNCYPWDYSQSSFPSKPTQSSVSLFLRVRLHTLVMFGKQLDVPCHQFPAVEQAHDGLIFSLIWDSLLQTYCRTQSDTCITYSNLTFL